MRTSLMFAFAVLLYRSCEGGIFSRENEGVVSVYTTEAPKQAGKTYDGVVKNMTSSFYRLLGIKREKRSERSLKSDENYAIDSLMEDYGLNVSSAKDTMNAVVEVIGPKPTEHNVDIIKNNIFKVVGAKLDHELIRKTIAEAIGEMYRENKDTTATNHAVCCLTTTDVTTKDTNGTADNLIDIPNLFSEDDYDDDDKYVISRGIEIVPQKDETIVGPIQLIGRMFSSLVNVAVDSVSNLLVPKLSWYKMSEYVDGMKERLAMREQVSDVLYNV